jgi:hypothetical protein
MEIKVKEVTATEEKVCYNKLNKKLEKHEQNLGQPAKHEEKLRIET